MDTTLVKPRVDVASWALEIKGQVESPFSITYDQLLDLEAVEQAHTLECISNYVGGDLISTAVWTGVPLRDLSNRAQVKATAYDVVFTSVDGYTDSIPIAKAMEERTLVAYLMNGKTVPQDHGYPARMLVPNIYGMKNVKWMRTIEVVETTLARAGGEETVGCIYVVGGASEFPYGGASERRTEAPAEASEVQSIYPKAGA